MWIHAVSVGEVQAAAALVAELRRRAPDVPIAVSTVTPTGAQRARALFKDTVQHCYLPYDLPGSVRRFLDRLQPQVAVILETEIWPTLYAGLRRRRIPLVLGSARVSVRSVERYRRLGSLFRDALSHDVLIGAQTAADAERFCAIGADPGRVRVTGNIKYDIDIPAPVSRRRPGHARAMGRRAASLDRRQHARRRRGSVRSPRMRWSAHGTRTRCCCSCRGIRSVSTPYGRCCGDRR